MKQKITIIVLLASLLITGCKIKEISVGNVQGLKIKNVSKKTATLEFLIPVKNENNFSFKISKVNLNLSINRNKLGKVNKIRTVKIPANSDETHSFIIKAKYSDLLKGSVSMLGSLFKGSTKVNIEGYVKAKAFCVVSKKIEIDENRPIKLFGK